MSDALREVRPQERAEAVMVAAAVGASVDGAACVHACSHTLNGDEGVTAAAIAFSDRDGRPCLEVCSTDENADAVRALLDASLMKLRAGGALTARLRVRPDAADGALWQSAEWLARLPVIDRAAPAVRAPLRPDTIAAQAPAAA